VSLFTVASLNSNVACDMCCCCLPDYGAFLTSLVTQDVEMLPRGMKSAFSLRQQSSATSYHSMPVTSVLRAAVDELRSIGKHGSHTFDCVIS